MSQQALTVGFNMFKKLWWRCVRKQANKWFGAIALALLGAFSTQIVSEFSKVLNRAEIRAEYHQQLSLDVSRYMFVAELTEELLKMGVTSKDVFLSNLADYNKAIVSLREKEFVYRAWVNAHWDESTLKSYTDFFLAVRDLDKKIHDLNPAVEKLMNGTSEKIPANATANALEKITPSLKAMRTYAMALLDRLEEC